MNNVALPLVGFDAVHSQSKTCAHQWIGRRKRAYKIFKDNLMNVFV